MLVKLWTKSGQCLASSLGTLISLKSGGVLLDLIRKYFSYNLFMPFYFTFLAYASIHWYKECFIFCPPRMHQFGNIQDHRLLHRHQNFVEARAQTEEVENKVRICCYWYCCCCCCCCCCHCYCCCCYCYYCCCCCHQKRSIAVLSNYVYPTENLIHLNVKK